MDPRDTLAALKIDRDRSGGEDPEPDRRLLLLGLVTAIALVLVGAAFWWLTKSPVATVHTITLPVPAEGQAALNASGYVVAQQEATVAAQITGMVTAVYVTEGQRVSAGQVLAQLDDSAAKAILVAAQSQLNADLSLPPQFEAQLVRDTKTLERTQALMKANAVSELSLDTAVAAVGVDQAEVDHARGQVDVDRKNVELDQTQLSFTVIRAPFAGVVTERYAHPGEMISPQAVGGFTQTGICKVVDMSSLEIDVDVNEAYVDRVHAGQKAEAVLDAYPDWTIPSHVIGVVPTANQQKATVKVRVAFDKLDPRILPQMGVQVRFLAAGSVTASPILRIPAAALHRDGGKAFVFVVEDGHAARRAVKTMQSVGDKLVVRSGLGGGEKLIVSADQSLKDGEEVREP